MNLLTIDEFDLLGPIPSTISELCNLVELALALNQFTGSFITIYSVSCTHLLYVGNIPRGIGNLSKLITLNLQFNYISGKKVTILKSLTNRCT